MMDGQAAGLASILQWLLLWLFQWKLEILASRVRMVKSKQNIYQFV
jgi:hypothetical protein